MNETLKNNAKKYLKELLAQCTEGQQLMFKRMYCHKNLDATIDEAVDQMDESKIDWATTQCERTVANNKTQKTIQFKKWNCVLKLGKYDNNDRTAIQLINARDGSPVAVATVNIPDAPLEKDEVIIKNYSENEGMLDALVNAGIVQQTGKKVQSGFVDCDICKLLVQY